MAINNSTSAPPPTKTTASLIISRRRPIAICGILLVLFLVFFHRINNRTTHKVQQNDDILVEASADEAKVVLHNDPNTEPSSLRKQSQVIEAEIITTPSPKDESSLAYQYRICDNPITRTIPWESLVKGLDERLKFSSKALPRLTQLLDRHMGENWGMCKEDWCKHTRGWSGLSWAHERFDMMGNIAVKCPDLRSFGVGDEEKRFCWSDELISEGQCVVFSIGSNNQWGFEEDIFAKTNCTIHTFDCTVDGKVPEAIQSRVTFHKYCIGSPAAGPLFRNLDQLVEIAGVSHVSFLKMDIEGYEWEVITSILRSAQEALGKTGKDIFPNQMAVEFHFVVYWKGTNRPAISWGGRDLSPGEIYLYFENLFLEYGYVLADRHDNRYCKVCSEVVLVKAKC